MKQLLAIIIFWTFTNHSIGQELTKHQIDSIYSLNDSISKFESSEIFVTNFNKKNELWKIQNFNNNRIITIHSHKEDTYYTEIYFELNGKLTYANEGMHGMPINKTISISWNCDFYIHQSKVFYHISLGHGKTERDDWDENSIITLYNKRLNELNQVLQSK